MKGIEKMDLQNYYSKSGTILDIEMNDSESRAVITFESCKDAEFALTIPKLTLKNHSVWASPLKKKDVV
tara:strand:- start:492 stop:698 length:207 start_codon:yes stop_codon:yes gene_type:complete